MAAKNDFWQLTLYVAGTTGKSTAAIENLKRYCDTHFPNKYKIDVIDLLLHPHLAERDQILAIPTLVRKVPKPIRKIIGDLSNEIKVISALECIPIKEKL